MVGRSTGSVYNSPVGKSQRRPLKCQHESIPPQVENGLPFETQGWTRSASAWALVPLAHRHAGGEGASPMCETQPHPVTLPRTCGHTLGPELFSNGGRKGHSGDISTQRCQLKMARQPFSSVPGRNLRDRTSGHIPRHRVQQVTARENRLDLTWEYVQTHRQQ